MAFSSTAPIRADSTPLVGGQDPALSFLFGGTVYNFGEIMKNNELYFPDGDFLFELNSFFLFQPSGEGILSISHPRRKRRHPPEIRFALWGLGFRV